MTTSGATEASLPRPSEIHRNVVDDELRVPGIDGLRVNASMRSAVTSTNASARAMMVAEKGAAMTGG
jgi:hypothetical protein